MATGGCHCGAVRYEVDGEPQWSALCHCGDCRRASGAPMVAWAAFAEDGFRYTAGAPVIYESSELGQREFCGACGSGLAYRNATVLPGLVDVQVCTLDDPEAAAPGIHVQVAERLRWTHGLDALPSFDRYPGP